MKDLTRDGKMNLEDWVMWGKKAAKKSNLKYTKEHQKHWEAACEAFFLNDVDRNTEAWIKSTSEFKNI